MNETDEPVTARRPVRDVPVQRTAGAPSLRDRVPGHEVMTQLMTVQQSVGPRSRLDKVLGISPLGDESRAWYRGALGEIAVGTMLARLGPEWHVLHAVPVGKGDSDVDHVVLGPGGVFTINTKNHSGQSVWVAGRTFMVTGQKQPHLRKAEHEARRAAKRLSAAAGVPTDVTPVIAVVDPKRLTVRERPAGVVVLTADRLVRWLKKRPVALTAEQVAHIAHVAERPGTWHDGPQDPADAAVLRASFGALDRDVRQARGIRGAWRLAVAGGGPSPC